MHIDDLKYLRNPIYAYGDWLSVGQVSKNGRFLDNPGDPENWSNSYTQYIAEAAWRATRSTAASRRSPANLAQLRRGGRQGPARLLRPRQQQAHRVRLGRADRQRRRRGLVPLAAPATWTGPRRPTSTAARWPPRRRTTALGNTAKATEMRTLADQIQNAIVNVLWNPSRQLLRAPARRHQRVRCRGRRSTTTTRSRSALIPNTATYRQALRLFDDPAEYPIFPFYTANQVDKAAAAAGHPGSNNFSTINSTVQFRLLSSVLRNYPNHVDRPRPTTRSCSTGTPGRSTSAATPSGRTPTSSGPTGTARSITYRSWIHHNILGSSNWTLIEDVAGLRPRNDAKVELSPDQHRLVPLRRQQPPLPQRRPVASSGTTRPTASSATPACPQGYSIFVNGTRAATVNQLVPFTWDPATGAVTTDAARSPSTRPSSGLQAPTQVVQTRRPHGRHARQGRRRPDRRPDQPGHRARPSRPPTPAPARTHRRGGRRLPDQRAVLGRRRLAQRPGLVRGELRHRPDASTRCGCTSRTAARPAPPTGRRRRTTSSTYNGSTWTNVASQAKTPGGAGGQLQPGAASPPVTAQRVRVLATNASGAKTGLTEVKVYNRGGSRHRRRRAATSPCRRPPSASFTSAWESVRRHQRRHRPASRPTTPVEPALGHLAQHRRSSGRELTWPSAVSR